jgi:hypothetical protein
MAFTRTARFQIASCARKHGISKTRITEALSSSGEFGEDVEGNRLYFTGIDGRGTGLDLVGFRAREDSDLVVIIHAMPSEWRKK